MNDSRLRPTRFQQWLGSPRGRWLLLLVVTVLFAFPARLVEPPAIGIDPSWMLSLQWMDIHSKFFGRDFVFTYGPLGYLFIRAAVSKAMLLGYDFFIAASLLSIYRALLPARPALLDAVLLVVLALVTKACLWAAAPVVLFTILCYWLWRVYDRGDAWTLVGSFIAAGVLFFGKVNYGLIMLFLVPAYGLGLVFLHPSRRRQGSMLLLGFPALVCAGALIWQVDLLNYLRSSIELISGYNETMMANPIPTPLQYELASGFQLPVGFELAWPFLLAAGAVVWLGRKRLGWREQAVLLPLIGLAMLLLYKNAFVRSDMPHRVWFYYGLPLLLAIWSIAWRGANVIRTLLLISLFYPLALLTARDEPQSWAALADSLPLRYWQQAVTLPWRETDSDLQRELQAHYPQAVLPAKIRSLIGPSSVDVMPWESSVAILNGLNYHPRPVPQSYSVYTPWLDALNARFLATTNAPDYVLYTGDTPLALDGRAAAWDESMTKRILLENYFPTTEFRLAVMSCTGVQIQEAPIFMLRHAPGCRRLIPVATNEVSLTFNQPLPIPATTNLVFLTLDIRRSLPGRLQVAALCPQPLTATFHYQNGTSEEHRAVLPILKTGVLVNWRVESPDETRNWLAGRADRNPAVTAISFGNADPWAFQFPLKGRLVEYRLTGRNAAR